MKLSTTILAALVAALASPALGMTCEKACGSANSSCAQSAINKLLSGFGCLDKPNSVFLYKGGLTEGNLQNSPCRASLQTPSGEQYYMSCSKLRQQLENVRSKCIDSGSGIGQDGLADIRHYWKVSTCGNQ